MAASPSPFHASTGHNQTRVMSPPVIVILLMAFCTMLVLSCVDWTLLLYLNHVSLTSQNDSSLYINLSALALFMPAIANPTLGNLSARFGSGFVLSLAYLTVAFGVVLILFFTQNAIFFSLSFFLYAPLSSFRIVRISIIAELVPTENRTTVMALHQLMAPIGAIFGPLLWLLIETWHGYWTLPYGYVFDRFTVLYLFSAAVMAAMFIIGARTFPRERTTVKPTPAASDIENTTRLVSNVEKYGATTEQYGAVPNRNSSRVSSIEKKQRFAYLCVLIVMMEVSMGLVWVSFQPILVGVYGASEEEVGQAYALVAALAVLPSLVVAALSRVLSDRSLALFGIAIKLAGMSTCLPWFGALRRWQLMVAFVLSMKASTFFLTAALSVFTKKVGDGGSGKELGYMWAICTTVVGLTQMLFGSLVVRLYEFWGYSLCICPLVVALGMVMHPFGWQLLKDEQHDDEKALLNSTKEEVGGVGSAAIEMA